MKKIWWFLKCVLGFGSIKDGSICWFSAKYYDAHDYPKDKGGTGIPFHFHKYKCPKCGRAFEI